MIKLFHPLLLSNDETPGKYAQGWHGHPSHASLTSVAVHSCQVEGCREDEDEVQQTQVETQGISTDRG